MHTSKSEIGEVTIEAKIIRADGTVQDLGVIATNKKKGVIKRIIGRFKKWQM